MAADASLPLSGANLVFGEGNPDGLVCFVGEAPGFHEDRLKRPFVGRAGQLLDTLITGLGWKRGDVYITNIVKRRPPENRDPLPEEINAYKSYLARQIEILNPKIIATLGRFSMNYFLPFAKISRDHGKVFEITTPPSAAAEGGVTRLVIPLFHPAAALRSSEVLNQLKNDFKKLPAITSGKAVIQKAETPVFTARKKKEDAPQGKLF